MPQRGSCSATALPFARALELEAPLDVESPFDEASPFHARRPSEVSAIECWTRAKRARPSSRYLSTGTTVYVRGGKLCRSTLAQHTWRCSCRRLRVRVASRVLGVTRPTSVFCCRDSSEWLSAVFRRIFWLGCEFSLGLQMCLVSFSSEVSFKTQNTVKWHRLFGVIAGTGGCVILCYLCLDEWP